MEVNKDHKICKDRRLVLIAKFRKNRYIREVIIRDVAENVVI